MRNGPEAFQLFDGPHSEQLPPQWTALHGNARALWPLGFQEMGPGSLGTSAAAQQAFS
jgi:hypothetical protein